MKTVWMVCIAAFAALPVQAQTTANDNKPWPTITFRPIPKGPSVFGVFEGRSPCAGVAAQLKLAADAGFRKLKYNLVLYLDSLSLQPARFTLLIIGGGDLVKHEDGSTYRKKILQGRWSVAKSPGREIYVLQPDEVKADLYLFKGDENVLFMLDESKRFRIGDKDFSYTLNRVELVPGK